MSYTHHVVGSNPTGSTSGSEKLALRTKIVTMVRLHPDPQKWILQIVGDGARRARPRGERCKAPFIYAKKPPII